MRSQWLAALLAVLVASPSVLAAGDGPQTPPETFLVPGYWEPVDGKMLRQSRPSATADHEGLAWHEGYLAEARPLWQWRPSDWVPTAAAAWTYRPGQWVPADPQTRDRYLARLSSTNLSPRTGEDFLVEFERGWKVGHQTEIPDRYSIIEFVRESDDIADWEELLTMQQLPVGSLPRTPREVFERWRQLRESYCPGKTEVTVLAEDSVSILYEWRLTSGCDSWPAQHEISCWMLGPWSAFRVAYTNKQATMPEELRQTWIKRFSEAMFLAIQPPRPVTPLPDARSTGDRRGATSSERKTPENPAPVETGEKSQSQS